jgi:hypothetical protein
LLAQAALLELAAAAAGAGLVATDARAALNDRLAGLGERVVPEEVGRIVMGPGKGRSLTRELFHGKQELAHKVLA